MQISFSNRTQQMPTVTVLLLCLNEQLSYLTEPYRASSGNCPVSINSTLSHFTNLNTLNCTLVRPIQLSVIATRSNLQVLNALQSCINTPPWVWSTSFSFTVVQKWKAVARWRHWGINSSFTKSAGHTKTAGSRPAGRHELSPCFLSCIEPIHL